jgi:hypothetical protein
MPEPKYDTGRTVNANSPKTVMHVVEDSDLGIVPMNQPNKVDRRPTTEVGEGRPGAKENSPPSHLPPTQSGIRRSQGLLGVRLETRIVDLHGRIPRGAYRAQPSPALNARRLKLSRVSTRP